MNKKTLNALKGSIRKWEKIVSGTGVDNGKDNCPLCELSLVCEDCPVFKKTGLEGCEGTPYDAWVNHQRKVHNKHRWRILEDGLPEDGLKVLELKFLKSLLPKMECEKK